MKKLTKEQLEKLDLIPKEIGIELLPVLLNKKPGAIINLSNKGILNILKEISSSFKDVSLDDTLEDIVLIYNSKMIGKELVNKLLSY